MVRLGQRFGFPAIGDYRYRLHGRRYRVDSAGMQTLKLLSQICDSCAACSDQNRLVRLRGQIRQVQALRSRSLLSWVAQRTGDPRLRLLAIWLRGRCGGSVGTSILARFATHPDLQTRKEVARALKRMGAWVQLREMADNDPSARVRRLATTKPARDYRQRLSDYSKHIPRVPVTSARHPLFVSPELGIRQGRPAKSSWFIRLILERIHLLVGRC
jgi:hypothetical protein